MLTGSQKLYFLIICLIFAGPLYAVDGIVGAVSQATSRIMIVIPERVSILPADITTFHSSRQEDRHSQSLSINSNGGLEGYRVSIKELAGDGNLNQQYKISWLDSSGITIPVKSGGDPKLVKPHVGIQQTIGKLNFNKVNNSVSSYSVALIIEPEAG